MTASFVIITPVKDEICNIGRVMQSVLAQSVTPSEWLIVDDGSTDGTRRVLERNSEGHPWIHVLDLPTRSRDRALGEHIVDMLTWGLGRLRFREWDFWAKLDADIILPHDYFESLLEAFDRDVRLGMASGQAYVPGKGGGHSRLEWSSPHHVLGQARMYRRECWNDIGALSPQRHWDVIDVYVAQMNGWHTRSIPNLAVIHTRPIDSRQKGQLIRRFDSGSRHYTLGYHPVYFAARCLRALWDESPYIFGGLAMLCGFAFASVTRQQVYSDDLGQFIRHSQRRMLRFSRLIHYLCRRHAPPGSGGRIWNTKLDEMAP